MRTPYTLTTSEKSLLSIKFNPLDPTSWDKSVFDNLKSSIRAHLINVNIINPTPLDGIPVTTCFYCKSEFNLSSQVLHIEHILDKSHYPAFSFEPYNLTISCPVCNSSKGTKPVHSLPTGFTGVYPTSNFTIVHAYYDNYEDHIEIQDEIFHFGLTPQGKETIRICRLYRSMLAEELGKQAHRRNSDKEQGLAEKLVAAKDPAEILSLQQSINSLTVKFHDVLQLRKLMGVVNTYLEVRTTLSEIQDRFELFTLLTSIDELDFDKLLSFFQSLVTFQRLSELISGRIIKKELDDYIGSKSSILTLNNNTRMKILIDALINRNIDIQNVTEKVKNKYSAGFPQFCSDVDQIKDTANNISRIKQVMNLISRINRTSKVKQALLSITEAQITLIQNVISELDLSPSSSIERLIIRRLRLLFLLRRALFQYNINDFVAQRALINKLNS